VGEKSSEKSQKKKKMIEYKEYNLENLQNMSKKEQNPEELDKIMDAIVDKQEKLSDDNEETNNIKLEEEIYQ